MQPLQKCWLDCTGCAATRRRKVIFGPSSFAFRRSEAPSKRREDLLRQLSLDPCDSKRQDDLRLLLTIGERAQRGAIALEEGLERLRKPLGRGTGCSKLQRRRHLD